MAEEEIGALDHRPGRQPAANNAIEELAGLQFEQRLVGRVDQYGVNAHLGEDFHLPIDPDERFGGGLGPQNSRRRRIEGEHHGRPTDAPGHGPQSLDQPRMAQVDAVEIADRHGAAAKRFGKVFQAAESIHDLVVPRSPSLRI